MSEGLLYEPRSLWSIANILVPANAPGPVRTRLPRTHFFNGERWPIQINRVALGAINYPFANDSWDRLLRARVAVSVPQRYHVGNRSFLVTAGLCPRPTWGPSAQNAGGGPTASSLWSQAMLNFDKPLYMPKDGTIEWSLSSVTPVGDTAINPVPAWMIYQEAGGLWPGSARSLRVELPFWAPAAMAGMQFDSIEKWPYFAPIPGDGGDARVFWDPRGMFSASAFQRQEHTRDGSTKLTDMRVMIDERAYDNLEVFTLGGLRPTPLQMRIGTRVKTRAGGSGTDWWRPGAPLGLVFDKITPAAVYWLKEPITLRPGEQLDVEMLLSPIPVEPEEDSEYHIGISFNGFAAIEG